MHHFFFALVALIWPTLLDGALQVLPLTLPGQKGLEGVLQGPTAYNCYNLTFSDDAVRQLVWWEQGRYGIQLFSDAAPKLFEFLPRVEGGKQGC